MNQAHLCTIHSKPHHTSWGCLWTSQMPVYTPPRINKSGCGRPQCQQYSQYQQDHWHPVYSYQSRNSGSCSSQMSAPLFMENRCTSSPEDETAACDGIPNKVFHTGYLENRNNAYLLHLPKLQDMLHTSRFLMDETSGQFYTVYCNTYQGMSTKPMLKEKWDEGELINQLGATRQAFGYAGLSGSTPCLQHSPPAGDGQDDFIWEKPAPKTVQYQPPSLSLDRPMTCLTIEERIQVHHNYTSAVCNLEHKKDLINMLKRNNPQNIDAYEAEMWWHMALHNDVLGRILTILKQDNYYRTLAELPTIDSLRTYDDIRLFPELYDTITIIERVTSDTDLIERHLRWPGMYPLRKTPIPSTSVFVPRPTLTFKPVTPTNSQHSADAQNTYQQQSIGSSPGSSLLCEQHTPTASATNTSTPPQVVVSPWPATLHFPNPNSFNTPRHSAHVPSVPSPIWQPRQQSPLQTNTSSSAQSSTPAAATHTTMPSTSEQKVPKSLNGEGVKNNRQQDKPNAWNEQLCFHCKQPGHFKKNCPEPPYCFKCRTKGHIPAKSPIKNQTSGPMDEGWGFRGNKESKTTKLTERNINVHRPTTIFKQKQQMSELCRGA